MAAKLQDKPSIQLASIHKIWKHKKNELIAKTMSFRMDDFAIVDLTDMDTLRFLDGNGKSSTVSYKLLHNAITFPNADGDNGLEFKISKLTETELVLILHINLKKKDKTQTEADIMKMTFEAQ